MSKGTAERSASFDIGRIVTRRRTAIDANGSNRVHTGLVLGVLATVKPVAVFFLSLCAKQARSRRNAISRSWGRLQEKIVLLQ